MRPRSWQPCDDSTRLTKNQYEVSSNSFPEAHIRIRFLILLSAVPFAACSRSAPHTEVFWPAEAYFSADSRRIIFASNHETPRGGYFDLYLIRTGGTGLEKNTSSTEFDGFPMFSPDRHKPVWVSSRHSRVPGEINRFVADWKE